MHQAEQPARPLSCADSDADLETMFVDILLQGRIDAGQCPVLRPVFQKLHGVATCRLTMRRDLGPSYRLGIFARDGFAGLVRFSSDTLETANGFKTTLGAAVKLFGVDRGTILDGPAGRTFDLVLQNHPVFFVDNAAEMCRFIHAGVVEGDYNRYLDGHPLTARILDEMAKPVGSVLASPYWTILPHAHGPDTFAKLRLCPTIAVPAPQAPPGDAAYFANDLAARLRADGAAFTLELQLRDRPDAMPLDAATVPWEGAPFVAVADLVIEPQDIDTEARRRLGERLAFNIFRVSADHAPQGSLARARRRVYARSANVRRTANGDPETEPTAFALPSSFTSSRTERIVKKSFCLALGAFLLPPSPGYADPLVINEIGSSGTYVDLSGIGQDDVPVWFELKNTTGQPVDLSAYAVRGRARTLAGQDSGVVTFPLPSQTLAAGDYVQLRPMLGDDNEQSVEPTANLGTIAKVGDAYLHWTDFGFIELLSAGATVDFVRFGNTTEPPQSANAWSGTAAPALPYGRNSFGFALARSPAGDDSNAPADWTHRAFATPTGPNDVTCTADADRDGLPDCSEAPGGTFAGMPLHDWGARPGRRDIFVEVDYMLVDPSAPPGADDDPAVVPRREALAKVRDTFAAEGIALHFDAGDLFHQAPGEDPAAFDLGGGNAVPWERRVRFTTAPVFPTTGCDRSPLPPAPTCEVNLYDIKRANSRPARKQVFHYMLFAYRQSSIDQSGPFESGSSGRAELPGNDLVVSLGGNGLSSATPVQQNVLVNIQAGTILHEFGHNLNLRHGGFEHAHYKPNYLSSMNYLYQLEGLPDPARADAGDRYYQNMRNVSASDGFAQRSACIANHPVQGGPHDGPTSDPATFRIGYSNGRGTALDEAALAEAIGLGRGGAAVDFDCNNTTDGTNLSVNLDLDGQFSRRVLRDFDDWANIDLFFQQTESGDRSGALLSLNTLEKELADVNIIVVDKLRPIADDRQPWSSEPEPPAGYFERFTSAQ